MAADLKRIYQSATADEAEQRLGEFEAKWDDEYLPIGQSWRRNWPRLIPFFDYPPEIRKGHLHDQRHRVGEHEPTQADQESWLVSRATRL